MHRFVLPASLILIAAFAAAGFYFSGKDYVLRLSEEDIRRQLERQLPLKRAFLLIFEVELAHPRVQLHDGSERVDIGVDVQLDIRIGRETRPLGGSVDLQTGIRYERENGGLYLTDPVVTRLDVQGVPAEYAVRTQRVVAEALQEFVRRYPIHTLRAIDAKRATARLLLKHVVVANSELVLTLGL
ncbi:MAG TPA: DUF1439 domain-containing protein [Dokdonella sp.]